jgi:hypothetical protein
MKPVWRLTKHGRVRFIERVTAGLEDKAMTDAAQEGLIMGFFRGFEYHWRDDHKRCQDQRLVTIYINVDAGLWDDLYFLMDRPSKFTFNFFNFQRRFQRC